jgi:hypothetical protein
MAIHGHLITEASTTSYGTKCLATKITNSRLVLAAINQKKANTLQTATITHKETIP